MRRAVAFVIAAAMVTGACSRGPEAIEPRVVPLGGEVLLARGGNTATVVGATSLDRGDVVTSGGDGRARIELPGGTVDLAPRTTVRIEEFDRPVLLEGSVLAGARSPLTVGIAGYDVGVRGTGATYRLDRSLGSVRAGVYSGSVAIPGSGLGGDVGALSEVTVLPGGSILNTGPLQVTLGDPWDEQMLGVFMDIGVRLSVLQHGVALQLPERGRRTVVERAMPGLLRVPGARPQLRSLRPAEGLVASVVAAEAAIASGDEPVRVLRDVARLRGRGASWVIVVAEWALGRSLFAAVLAAAARLAGVLPIPGGFGGAQPGPGPSPSPSPSPTVSPPPTKPDCSDGRDNDGDGLIDGDDPGCESPEDRDETDPPCDTLCQVGELLDDPLGELGRTLPGR